MRMIVLLTDYGLDGLYVGQLHTVIQQRAPGTPVIDLIHTLPDFDIRSTAYLLPAYTRDLPEGSVIVCVVDPGVGSPRPHCIVVADGRFFVGPDNGCFDVLMQHANEASKYHLSWPEPACRSFHGRDVYVPAACRIVLDAGLAGLELRPAGVGASGLEPDLAAIVYIDSFGNAISGLRAASVSPKALVSIAGRRLHHASTFSDVPAETCFWYANANGLLEIAANRGSAAEMLGLSIGDGFVVEPVG